MGSSLAVSGLDGIALQQMQCRSSRHDDCDDFFTSLDARRRHSNDQRQDTSAYRYAPALRSFLPFIILMPRGHILDLEYHQKC
jgi:hypothetical protein